MSRNKKKEKDFIEDDFDEDDFHEDIEEEDLNLNPIDDEDDFEDAINNAVMEGDKKIDAPTSDLFYNLNPYLYDLRQTLLGKQLINNKYIPTTEPKLRTSVIDMMINQMRSVLSTHNFHSQVNSEQINQILQQQNFAFIRSLRAEPSMKNPSEVESVAVFFDVTLQLFISALKDGKGAESVRQSMTGNYQNLNMQERERQKGLRVGYGKNELEIGGERY